MSVTAETVREVAEELRTHDLTSLADSLDIFAKKLLPAPDPDIELANELALAYFANGDHHRVVSHRYVTEGWLRVVALARKALVPTEPRKFHEGDPEPDDITYVYDEDGYLFKRITPDCWFMKSPTAEEFGPIKFEWREINCGGGATELFGDLG